MKRIIFAIGAGLASYVITKQAQGRSGGRKGKRSKVEWISAEEDGSAEAAERPDEVLPMFYIGDSVNKYDPHLGALYYEYEGAGPAYYEITDVRYDDEYEVFEKIRK